MAVVILFVIVNGSHLHSCSCCTRSSYQIVKFGSLASKNLQIKYFLTKTSENSPQSSSGMKRLSPSPMGDDLPYHLAVKKAQLVERNPTPNGIGLLDPLRTSTHDASDIISLANQIQTADLALKNSACGKLTLILDQIRMLQAQAKTILKETEENQILHSAACNFSKQPGKIYHLYQRESGQHYFSMLSPEEWNGSCQHKFIGSYRLEYDSTWTSVDKLKQRDRDHQWAEKVLSSAADVNCIPAIEAAAEKMEL